ncbi:MAG: hypothetical protein BGO24_09035 [Sphingomonas sp. 67-36]|nr:MAG: hypothetical protein BGO24_09035 [Sphingomonas sp. 67-36]
MVVSCNYIEARALSDAEPFQIARQHLRSEIDLQDSSLSMANAGSGCVEDRGGIGPNVSSLCETGEDAEPLHRSRDFRLGYAPQSVRAGCDQQRCVVRRHVVDMDPQCRHSLDDREWRLDMDQPGFATPRAEAGYFAPLTHDDRPILMPAERPVGAG